MTPGSLAATIWLSLGAIGTVAEGCYVLLGRHDGGDVIRRAARENPAALFAVAIGSVLSGPIQLGLLIGSYRRSAPPPLLPPKVVTMPCDRCGNRHEVLALLPLPNGREEKVCGDCLTSDPDSET